MGVPQPVNDKAWGGAIGERIMWMVQGDQQFARLQLNPPQLGPLEVRVSVNHDQTSVSFLASHAVVREALEAALPRLREMFDQQSMQLVRADVSDPGTQHGGSGTGRSSESREAAPGLWGDDEQESVSEEGAGMVSGAADSLVDLFA
jgi:flagellar hook-length control protein FliK